MGRTWPLTGRDAERTALREGIEGTALQVVLGPAGVGKTRLVTEVVDDVAATGVRTGRIVGASSVVSLPLAPFTALLDPRDGTPSVPAVVSALGGDRSAGPGAPVLQVDDAHLLDAASAALLYQLGVDGRVRLVLTIRTGEPLDPAITSLVRDVDGDRTLLGPLSDGDASHLLVAALGGRLDGAARRRLVEVAGGNPLLLRELTEGAVASGMLVCDRGLWRFTRDLVVDPVLEEIVSARLGPLDQASRDVLELLALAGALDVADLVEEGALGPLEDLEREGLVDLSDDESGRTVVALAHPIQGEVLRGQMPRIARLRHCRRLALLWESRAGVDPEADTEATLWRFEAGDRVDAARLVAAADRLREIGDPAAAARLAVAACEADPTPEAVLLASWALGVSGRQAESTAIVATHLEGCDDDMARAALSLRLAEQHVWAGGDPAAADAVLADAAERLGASPWASLVTAQRAVFDVLDGRITGVEERTRPLLHHDEPGIRTTASLAAELAFAEGGRGAEGAALAAGAFDDALANPVRFIGDPGIHVVARGVCCIGAGDLDEATGLADLLYAAAVTLPGVQPRAWASLTRGQVLAERGLLDDAIADLTEAELIWSDLALDGVGRWAATRVALAAAARGDLAGARAALARADALRAEGFRLYAVGVARARAWVAALGEVLGAGATDDLGAALGALAAEVATAAADGRFTEATVGAVDLVRLGDPGAADVAMARVPRLDEGIELRRRAVERAAAGDAAGLESSSAELAARGWLPLAADWAVLAATAHRADGDAPRTERCLTTARTHVAACQGLATPLVRDLVTRSPLSRREREIADLAAEGWSSRRIAGHLVLSERTVENHLYRAFAKLGISSREELGALLRS